MVHPSLIPDFIDRSEVIVSPRSRGTNTPLKIYGYLRAGKPIVATDLLTHTQILDTSVAHLVPPTPAGLSQGLLKVLKDAVYANDIARNARQMADAEFTDENYIKRVQGLYAQVLGRHG